MTGLTAIENGPLFLPDIANSNKGWQRLLRVSSAIISSIKNRVLSPVRRLLIFSIK